MPFPAARSKWAPAKKRWGQEGRRGAALLGKRKDNWFTGSLKCSEIIPLAAQFP